MMQSLRMLARDWRAGEVRVLAAALVIAVAAITSVAFSPIASARGSRAMRISFSAPTWSSFRIIRGAARSRTRSSVRACSALKRSTSSAWLRRRRAISRG
jgi:hypothetical protein